MHSPIVHRKRIVRAVRFIGAGNTLLAKEEDIGWQCVAPSSCDLSPISNQISYSYSIVDLFAEYEYGKRWVLHTAGATYPKNHSL